MGRKRMSSISISYGRRHSLFSEDDFFSAIEEAVAHETQMDLIKSAIEIFKKHHRAEPRRGSVATDFTWTMDSSDEEVTIPSKRRGFVPFLSNEKWAYHFRTSHNTSLDRGLTLYKLPKC